MSKFELLIKTGLQVAKYATNIIELIKAPDIALLYSNTLAWPINLQVVSHIPVPIKLVEQMRCSCKIYRTPIRVPVRGSVYEPVLIYRTGTICSCAATLRLALVSYR